MIQLRAISRGMICGLLLSQLCSCSSTPLEPTVIELEALFDDSLFKPVANIPSVEDIFSLPSSVAVDVKRSYDRYVISTKNPLAVHEWLASYINANQDGGR